MGDKSRFTTREEWLATAVERCLRPEFKALKFPSPPLVRASCSWPSRHALARKRRRIGECWPRSASSDGANEIFISPILETPAQVLPVLYHEYVHAVDDCKSGHKSPFAGIAAAVGLVKPWTATSASPDLEERCKRHAQWLGAYPHARLDKKAVEKDAEKKQTTRMIKLICEDCGYTVRTTRKWLMVGFPTCCCSGAMELEDEEILLELESE